ncbi:MAG TPA: Omp28-related outer membrane protein [Flavobacteriales bacterium]|nr:Omp28-related outer membrane protein [Flavobacteriales bacterium]
MKILSFFAFFIVLATFTSCDRVEFPNKETTSLVDVSDTIFPDTNTNTIRHVMIEEFTGQKCPPCPGGARVLRDLATTYETAGKHLVVVSIHEGSQCSPNVAPDTSFLYEYRVASGNYLANVMLSPLLLPGTPAALVNRTIYPGYTDPWTYKDDWEGAADLEFAKPNVVNLDMVATYDSIADEGTIAVRSWFVENMTGDYYLMVYLLQDSIKSWQKNGPAGVGDDSYPLGQDIDNYYHRHVFRGCLSNVPGGSGILVSSGSVSSGTKIIKAFNFSIAELKDASHENILSEPFPPFIAGKFSAVAFVYDFATNEVLQVVEGHFHYE